MQNSSHTWAGPWIRWHSCPYQTLPVSFHCPGKTGYVSSAGLQRQSQNANTQTWNTKPWTHDVPQSNQNVLVLMSRNPPRSIHAKCCQPCDEGREADTVFAVQGEGEAVLLLVQLYVTLLHCFLQRGQRPEHCLHTLIHTYRNTRWVTK